jgi:chitinase
MKIIGYLNYDYEHLPDPHLLTHINFSFAELYVRNAVYDHFELCGQNIEKLINVVKLKEINTELKVLISFTSQIHNKDNFQDGGFSAICNSEEQTEHLINDIIKFIEDYNLDGVDLNWEYPCEKWSGQTPLDNDRHNFNIFVKKLKHSLPKEKILTYASYVFPNQKFCDLVLQQYIEHINVMCYDLGEGTKKCHITVSMTLIDIIVKCLSKNIKIQ